MHYGNRNKKKNHESHTFRTLSKLGQTDKITFKPQTQMLEDKYQEAISLYNQAQKIFEEIEDYRESRYYIGAKEQAEEYEEYQEVVRDVLAEIMDILKDGTEEDRDDMSKVLEEFINIIKENVMN